MPRGWARRYIPEATSKTCKVCGVEKELREFHKNSSSPDLTKHTCKMCAKAAGNKWATENPEKAREAAKAWDKQNREKINARVRGRKRIRGVAFYAQQKTWYLANAEYLKAKRAARYAQNRERIISANKAYYQRNIDRARSVARVRSVARYYAKKDLFLEYARSRRARKAGAEGQHTHADILVLMKSQKGRCAHAWCRVKLNGKHHVDHIMPLILGGSNYPSNLQLLCKTCNLSKGGKHPIDFALQHGVLV